MKKGSNGGDQIHVSYQLHLLSPQLKDEPPEKVKVRNMAASSVYIIIFYTVKIDSPIYQVTLYWAYKLTCRQAQRECVDLRHH